MERMTWKEFKDKIEASGVTDDMQVNSIHVDNNSYINYPQHVIMPPTREVKVFYVK